VQVRDGQKESAVRLKLNRTLFREFDFGLLMVRRNKGMSHGAHERHSALGHGNVALEDRIEIVRGSEVDICVFLVLAYAGSVEIDAGKQALGARVAKQLCVHLPVSGSLTAAAYRACGS